MKVYVAGASGERERAARVIAELRSTSAEVVHDWPAIVEEHGGQANEGLTPEQCDEISLGCLQAAVTADVLLLLVPHCTTIGAWVELGAAWFAGVVLVGSGIDSDCARTVMLARCSHVVRVPLREFQQTDRPSVRVIDRTAGDAQRIADDRAIAWLAGYQASQAWEGEA